MVKDHACSDTNKEDEEFLSFVLGAFEGQVRLACLATREFGKVILMRLMLEQYYSSTLYELSDDQIQSLLDLDARKGLEKLWTFNQVCGYDFEDCGSDESNQQMQDEYDQAKDSVDYILDFDKEENMAANWAQFVDAMKVRLDVAGPGL